MEEKTINWEERRFIAASIILAGICSNYAHPFTCRYEAEDAVKLADSLISVLTDVPINDVCAHLYQSNSR